ncbi:MAG: DUF302 domain-containing protein [Acidimicrobiia bacterium]
MKHLTYGMGIVTDKTVEEAEAAVRSALAEEGFGILTEIDVAGTLKEKLDIDRPAYRILGACNPSLAHRALQADEHMGLLLPCNVIIYQSAAGTAVEAMEPGVMADVSGVEAVHSIAAEARQRMLAALERVEAD